MALFEIQNSGPELWAAIVIAKKMLLKVIHFLQILKTFQTNVYFRFYCVVFKFYILFCLLPRDQIRQAMRFTGPGGLDEF